MSSKLNYVCTCYYSHNFFIRRLGHVVFVDRAQFIRDYAQVLQANTNYLLVTCECVCDSVPRLTESETSTVLPLPLPLVGRHCPTRWNNMLRNKTTIECWNILKYVIESIIDQIVPLKKKQGKRSRKEHVKRSY